MAGAFGPFSPKFHKNVGVYLSSSPSAKDKDCLQRFFELLRSAPVECPFKTILSDVHLVYMCNHVIKFVGNGSLVVDISPGQFFG